jgi:hypothetical protein
MMKLCLASLGLLLTACAAHAESASFKSPTGNINCIYSDYDNKPEVRCDIMQFTPSFKTVPPGTSNEVIRCTPQDERAARLTLRNLPRSFCGSLAAMLARNVLHT